MAIDNSNVKIENGKVVFSQEVLEYYENLRTDENSEWIDKYFEVLSDSSNFNAEKFNKHHIRPCCTFKDKNHKNRKETQKLGDEFKGNVIKISIYNHLFAHFYLWKIFNNKDLKRTFQRMCGEEKYINDLTEDEVKEITRLREECAKKNLTKEEFKEYQKQWYEDNKEEKSRQYKERYKENKEEILKRNRKWKENNKEKRKEHGKLYRENNKEKESKRTKKWYEENKDKVLKRCKERYENNKEEIIKQRKERNHKLCIDPIKGDECMYSTLIQRKVRNKERYEGVIASKCIKNPQSSEITIFNL